MFKIMTTIKKQQIQEHKQNRTINKNISTTRKGANKYTHESKNKKNKNAKSSYKVQ